MIILEGPDGSGKTTLANQLCQMFGLERFHAGAPAKTKQEIEVRIELQLSSYGKVLDRVSCISEYVYSRTIRKDQPKLFTFGEFIEYFMRMINNNWIFVHCDPGLEVILENSKNMLETSKKKGYKSEEHTKKVIEEISNIYEEYRVLFKLLKDYGAVILNYDWRRTTCAV